MRIEQFSPDADSAAVQACHEIYLAGIPFDDPNVPPLSARSFAGWPACMAPHAPGNTTAHRPTAW
jgi:hypothetical protein